MLISKTTKYLLGAAALAFMGGSVGQSLAAPMKPGGYPSRPITVMVCFGKSGGSAQSVQAMKGPAAKIMGARINMISKPGGGGVNCLPDFQQTPADGYTILQHTDTFVTTYVKGAHDLHPGKDLIPLLIMNVAPTGLYIRGGDKRFMTDGKPDFDKVVKYAKQGEGKLSLSNINADMELITRVVVEKHFGYKTKQVLFGKPAQRYGAVIGGKLDILMEQPGDVIKHVQAGKLLPVLAIWPDRFAVFGDTKATGADYGMKWNPLLRIRSFWVKSDTPQPIKDYLNAAFSEAYKSDVHQAFLKRKALDIVNSYYGSKDMAKIFDEAIGTYAKVFKETGQRLRKDMQ